MIGKWLRQDPATRAVTNWLLIGPLSMSAVLALIAWNAADGARRAQEVGSWSLSGFSTWIGLLWLAVGPFLLTPGCRERCSRLSLTLPQSPRKLWLVHLVAIFLAKAAIGFVAAALVLLKAGILIYVLDGRNIFQPDVVRLVLFASSGFVLATVLVQSLQPELRRIPMTKRNAALTAVIHVGVWGTILLLGSQSLWFALVPLGAALLVGSRTYKGMPTTFSVVSLELERPFRVNEDRARPVRGMLFKPRQPFGLRLCRVRINIDSREKRKSVRRLGPLLGCRGRYGTGFGRRSEEETRGDRGGGALFFLVRYNFCQPVFSAFYGPNAVEIGGPDLESRSESCTRLVLRAILLAGRARRDPSSPRHL